MALIIAAGNGFGMVMVQTSSNTTFQSVPDALRGRIIGVSQALTGASSQLIQNGDEITVDGDQGLVLIQSYPQA
jgi:hypothetical protein